MRATLQSFCEARPLPISSASASSEESGQHSALRAIDGNSSTRWSSEFSDPQWLRLDLGEERSIAKVEIDWEAAASADYSIEISSNGDNFTEIHREPAANGGADTIDGLSAVGRYLRIYSHARSTEWGNSIHEVRIFGETDDDCGTDEPSPVPLPARLQAEDYVSAYELSPGSNSGGACDRGDGVDMENTTDSNGGGCSIGWTQAGEWVEYSVFSAEGGSYTVTARVAAGQSPASYRFEVDGEAVGETVSVAHQGWSHFGDSSAGEFVLTPGEHSLRFVWVDGNVNLNWLELQEVDPGSGNCNLDADCDDGAWCNGSEACINGTCASAASPPCDDGDACTQDLCDETTDACSFLPLCTGNLPGRLEAEDYSSATDSSPGNSGGSSSCDRGDDVDLEEHGDSKGGPCNVGWTDSGERLDWTLDAGNGGTYSFVARAASNSGGGAFHLEVDGLAVSDEVSVDSTGGWQSYEDIRVTSSGAELVYVLAPGSHTISLVVDAGGFNLNYLDVLAAVESCDDGVLNQGESFIDCGGPCDACPPLGLNQRASNSTCLAGDAPAPGELNLRRIWADVSFSQPLGVMQAPQDDSTFYVLEKSGRVRTLPANDEASSGDAGTFLDLTNGLVNASAEGGLLGLAFHPEYTSNRHAFVSYTTNQGGSGGVFKLRLSRFTSTDGGNTLDLSTEQVLLEQEQQSGNHNSGHIAFDNTGLLYMAIGDDDFDPHSPENEANDPSTWRGSILRLDVDQNSEGKNYGIPSDNPFVSGGGAPEVYAYGLRNPWRFSFDRNENDLWVADVGESDWDEVNRVTAGSFYGWPNFEADMCFNGDCTVPYEHPMHAYDGVHGSQRSVTGGFVYRGGISALQGKYVFGDFQLGKVWTLDRDSGAREELFSRSFGLAAWGEDNQGELYYVDLVNGEILRLEESAGGGAEGPPSDLFATGCFDQVGSPPLPAEGVLPISVAQRFWSDGAEKERWLALPDGTSMTINEVGDWELPPGAVTIKHFKWNGKYFESRFFVRYNDGSYGAYTYRWADDETSATLVDERGESRDLGGIVWQYPSQGECFQCHTPGAGFSLALETQQLNIDHYFTETGALANQLETLVHLGYARGNTEPLPAFPSISDDSISLDERANSYLHVNCSSCHRGDTGGRAKWNALSTVPFESKGLCNVPPIDPWSSNPAESLVTPGDHTLSTVWLRMHQREVAAMPPLSQVPDSEGAALLSAWINSLDSEICSTASTSCNSPGNLVNNCDFESGDFGWSMRLASGANATGQVLGGEYRMDVPGPGSELWHAQGIQVLGALSAGSYQIRFDGRAASPRSIQVELGEEGDDWTSLCAETIELTPSMQSFTVNCGPLAADNHVKINFNVGDDGNDETVFIDNAYVGAP